MNVVQNKHQILIIFTLLIQKPGGFLWSAVSESELPVGGYAPQPIHYAFAYVNCPIRAEVERSERKHDYRITKKFFEKKYFHQKKDAL